MKCHVTRCFLDIRDLMFIKWYIKTVNLILSHTTIAYQTFELVLKWKRYVIRAQKLLQSQQSCSSYCWTDFNSRPCINFNNKLYFIVCVFSGMRYVGPNGKVNNMMKPFEASKYDLVNISDSSIQGELTMIRSEPTMRAQPLQRVNVKGFHLLLYWIGPILCSHSIPWFRLTGFQ